jgi:hypothetical protein
VRRPSIAHIFTQLLIQQGWLCIISHIPGVANEFLVDTSGSGKVSSTMSYEFIGAVLDVLLWLRTRPKIQLLGSSVSVFGTVPGLNELSAYTSTNVSFSIDGNVISNSTFLVPPVTRRHVPFFVSPFLPSSSSGLNTHTLEIDILTSAAATNESNFLIDYLIYNATINSTIPTPEKQTSWVFVDDQSEYLQYSNRVNGWSQNVLGFQETPNFNLTDAAFNSSVTGPTSASSSVSLHFTGACYS